MKPVSIKITEKSAASLQWRGVTYVAWDSELKGFGVRVWGEGGRKAYVIKSKRHGRSYFNTLGKVGEMKADAAREMATTFRGAVRDGRDPLATEKAERDAWTLVDAMTFFLGTHAKARKLDDEYHADSQRIFEHHTPARWKDMPLAAITRTMIVARHAAITEGVHVPGKRVRGGSRRANSWLSLMSRLFTLAKQEGRYDKENPAAGIKKNAEVQRERFLSQAELRTLWTYLENNQNVEAAACAQFILLTGCRPSEAYTMKWSELDKDTGRWTKPAPKTKRRTAHTVTLTDKAKEVLGRLSTWKRSEYVFPSPEDATQPRSDKLKAFWRVVRKNCALPDVRLYDLRHTFGSWLNMQGATLIEIAAQLGHNNIQTTTRYVHVEHEHLRSKAELMGNVIDAAMLMDQTPIVADKNARTGHVTEHLGTLALDEGGDGTE